MLCAAFIHICVSALGSLEAASVWPGQTEIGCCCLLPTPPWGDLGLGHHTELFFNHVFVYVCEGVWVCSVQWYMHGVSYLHHVGSSKYLYLLNRFANSNLVFMLLVFIWNEGLLSCLGCPRTCGYNDPFILWVVGVTGVHPHTWSHQCL